MTDTAYLKWFHAVGMYTLAEWSLVPQECGVPWRDWYDEGLSAEAAFARAQQEHESGLEVRGILRAALAKAGKDTKR